MTADEIFAAAHQALGFGYGTVVLQSGEDYGFKANWMADVIRKIKSETPLAVTLSLGERTESELAQWRQAGADRYLLRFETSDTTLFEQIHPRLHPAHATASPGGANRHALSEHPRISLLRRLRELGYQVGSGIMIGLPGQSYESVANDICLFRDMDLDMIGIGPFIAHPQTPLGNGNANPVLSSDAQVPNTELMVYKAMALTRLVRPDANIPSTSALATINKRSGRELGLQRGANVVMPNLTPLQYRPLYQIYPAKACLNEVAEACNGCISMRIAALGRHAGKGAGGRMRKTCVAVGL